MKDLRLHLPESMSAQARTAFWITLLVAAAHIVATPFYLSLASASETWQFAALTGITLGLGLLFLSGTVLSWRGQPASGIILVFGVLTVAYPPIATLAKGLGLVLGLALMVAGPTVAHQTLVNRARQVMIVITLLSGLATILLDLFGSLVRPSLPGMVIQILAGSVVAVFGVLLFRQLGQSRLQTRLTALILIITIPMLVGVTAFISSRAGQAIEAQANTDLAENNDALATNVSMWLDLYARTLHEMSMLPDIVSMEADSQRPTLQIIAAAHPNLFLVQTTNLEGFNIARNDDSELKDYYDRDWFLGAKSGAPVTIEALISRTTGKPALNLATPIRNESGQIIGVASIVSQLDEISREVLKIEEGHGITYIVDADNRVVAHPDPTYTAEELRDLSAYPPVAALRTGETGLITFTDEGGEVWRAYVSTLDNGWGIIAQQPEAELLAPVKKFQNTAILVIAAGIALLLALAWFTIRRTLQPIGTLTDTVSAIAAGDLNRMAEVKGQDEIGILASTFNTMTGRLRDLISSLEERVAERTHSLELAAEVIRSVSQVRDVASMLKDAAELIRSRFGLYYVQVYLTNPSRNTLLLKSGTGSVGTELVGRGHSLAVDLASINGRAATEKRSIVISDTTTSATFRPNPLLPETRSEMAIPLIVAEKVIGVLDLQSQNAGGLNEEMLTAFEALAGQLAIAIQNAGLLAETQQARVELEAQTRRLVRKGWQEYQDAIHQPENTGFVFEHDQLAPLNGAELAVRPGDSQALTATITVAGESLGRLVVDMGAQNRQGAEQQAELVDIVARQVAQQIENLRLLESAERYRFEAEQATRRLTVDGWKQYMQGRTSESLGWLYDTNEVRPIVAQASPTEDSITVPLKANDEPIGKLAIQGLEADELDGLELANAVAERLGAHIENLRLLEDTRQGQIELDVRARQLAAVAEVSTASSRQLDIQQMLETVVHLTQQKFGFYHAHIFLSDERTGDLTIAACGWKEGEEHQGTHDTSTISLHQELSLVARAARTRQAVIVNDVYSDAGWLPNPLLPDTRSEMVVPLVIGDQMLGVLDVQSDRLNAFSEEDASIQTTLASQVAAALQNARSFARAQKQARQESMLNAISQKIQTATSVEAVLQIAARELGHALGAPLTIAQLGVKTNGNGNG
jgi:GAF domain-containing protein/HAMP domain-containing protein